jgi:hypothetical protein
MYTDREQADFSRVLQGDMAWLLFDLSRAPQPLEHGD